MGIGKKVYTGEGTHKWVREEGNICVTYFIVCNIFYCIGFTISCKVMVGSSSRLGSHPVVFSLVVHFQCILCFSSILTAQLK